MEMNMLKRLSKSIAIVLNEHDYLLNNMGPDLCLDLVIEFLRDLNLSKEDIEFLHTSIVCENGYFDSICEDAVGKAEIEWFLDLRLKKLRNTVA